VNGRKAKLLQRLSVLMAKEPSVLQTTGGPVAYPKKSARAIYQRLKRISQDPQTYRVLQLTYHLHQLSEKAPQAAAKLRELQRQLTVAKARVGGLRGMFSG